MAGPRATGGSAAMVPRPFRLKFGREMGTYPGSSMSMGTPTPGSGGAKTGFQGPCSSNRVWMLQRTEQQTGMLQWGYNLQCVLKT